MDYTTACDLTLATNLLALGEWLALGALLVVLSVSVVRQAPRDAALALGLTALALLVRLLSAPRLPMLPAHQDFTHVRAAATWLAEGLGVFAGTAYPAAGRTLLYAFYSVFGPSMEGSFWVFTAMGCLTAVPVYALARMLSGSRATGALAAACFAVMPPVVFFGSGASLESLGGFLLTLHLALFLWATGLLRLGPNQTADPNSGQTALPVRTGAVLWAWAISGVLFCQTRGEGVAIGLYVLVVEAALMAGSGLLRQASKDWWRLFTFAAFLMVPWLLLLAGSDNLQAAGDNLNRVLAAAAAAAVAMALAIAADRAKERRRWVAVAWDLGLVMLGTYWLYSTVQASNGNLLYSVPQTSDSFPYTTYYGTSPVVTGYSPFYAASGIFPVGYQLLTLVALWLGRPGLAPVAQRGETAGSRLPLASWTVALLLIPVLAQATLSLCSGNAVAEGVRYLVPHLGTVAVVAGLGAGRVLRLGSGWKAGWRLATAGLVVAFVLSPLLTHRVFTSDVRYNMQHEMEFVRSFMQDLPGDAEVFYPDFQVHPTPEEPLQSPAGLFRIADLLYGLAYLERGAEHTLQFDGLSTVTSHTPGPEKEVFLYLGVDCYRVEPPLSIHPMCEAAARLEGVEQVSTTTFANRVYCGAGLGHLGPRVPQLTLGLYRIAPKSRNVLTTLLQMQ